MAVKFSKLTRPAIRGLKIGAKITEHSIIVQRLRDGDVHYSVNIMVDGQRIHRVIGRQSDGTTRTQAEEFIAMVRSDAKAGRLNLPKGRKVALTFRAAGELYLERLKASDGKNLEEKERHFRLYLMPELGSMRLDRISTFTLEKYRKARKSRGLAAGTVNRHLATYRHMAAKLYEWGLVDAPMPMIKLEGERNRREYVLDREGKNALLESALRDSNSRIWLFIMIGLHTSLRHAEILSARFEHFDAARLKLRVRVKGGIWRNQPLTPTVAKVLTSERQMASDQDGWIFPNSRSRSGHTESMKAAFRRVVIGAGLDPKQVTPHTMRHTAITEMAETGAEGRTIQAFSGHKSREMVWRYTHARDQRVNEAMQRFDSESFGESSTKVERLRPQDRRRS